MKRNAFALTIREEKEGEFRRMLGQKWDDITELLDRMQADNFSLWQMGQQVFGYCETPDGEVCADAIKAAAEIADEFSGCAEWIAKPADGMRLMYHDFGIVRKNKELIRHRVFATKCCPRR